MYCDPSPIDLKKQLLNQRFDQKYQRKTGSQQPYLALSLKFPLFVANLELLTWKTQPHLVNLS